MWIVKMTKEVAQAMDAGATTRDEISMILDLKGSDQLDLVLCLSQGVENGYWTNVGTYALTDKGRELLKG
jgi:hypothetical protein